ncbi:hypothetical protein ACQP2Y_19270 [Actinoplanes sp. CA-051413]|uniref:hypothetical protein n=1 Tax=Actinoplanes sp. CA-051413 TaxID=3239899 RepID=UPI003D99B1DB
MTDDDLRARLRDADPAAHLAPLSPDRTARLLEDSMITEFGTAPPRPRPVRRWALAAAGLVLVAAAATGTGAVLRAFDGPGPGPGVGAGPVPGLPTVSPAVTVTRIVVAGDTAAKCMPPDPAILARVQLAFAGTVERIAGGTAVLHVTHLYAGPLTGVVEVAQSDGNSEALIGATVFEPGRQYLVAATDGQALVCGYSGLATPELQALYDAAF